MSSVRGYTLHGDYGRVRAANFDYNFKPTHQTVGAHPVIMMHQAGVSFIGQYAQSTNPMSAEIGPALAQDLGVASAGGALDGNVGNVGSGMGSNSVMTDIGKLLSMWGDPATQMKDIYDPNVDISKAHFIGTSMGLHACLRYAQLNPTKVASVTGIVGLADAMHTYDDVPAQQANMLAAWGVGTRAALAASGFNTLAGMAALNGVVPVQMFYSTADTVVLPITQTSVGALLGAALYPVSGTLDHTAAEQIMQIIRNSGAGDWSAIKDFIAAHDPAL